MNQFLTLEFFKSPEIKRCKVAWMSEALSDMDLNGGVNGDEMMTFYLI